MNKFKITFTVVGDIEITSIVGHPAKNVEDYAKVLAESIYTTKCVATEKNEKTETYVATDKIITFKVEML